MAALQDSFTDLSKFILKKEFYSANASLFDLLNFFAF
jgi:hypothetical protein